MEIEAVMVSSRNGYRIEWREVVAREAVDLRIHGRAEITFVPKYGAVLAGADLARDNARRIGETVTQCAERVLGPAPNPTARTATNSA